MPAIPPVTWHDLRTSLMIGLCCLLIYNSNGRAIVAGDTYPARYLPFAIWRHHTVVLDPIAAVASQGRDRAAYWMVRARGGPENGGHLISLYSVVLPVLIAPLYLPAVAYLQLRGWTDQGLDRVARIMEKLTASLIAALSASLLYLLLRRRTDAPNARLLTVAFAFGTTAWVLCSQALWQHGMAQLLMIGALLVLTAPCTARRALAAGLLCGLIAGNRPADAVLAAAIGAYGLYWAARHRTTTALLFTTAAALPLGLVLLYNLGVAGHYGGGYGLAGNATFFQHDPLAGLAGLLFSPARGLFVFSPFLLFLLLAWRHLPSGRDERLLALAMGIGAAAQLVLYSMTDWRAGLSWGPRFLTNLMPILMLMLVPVAAALRGFGRVCFLVTIGIAMTIEAIGAFTYTGASDRALYTVPTGPDKLRAAWDWRNAAFIASPRAGLAPPELTLVMRGELDTLVADGRDATTVTAGQKLIATGWALAGHATPRRVALLIDGRPVSGSDRFHDRPDVRATLPGAGPAGWRMTIDTATLTPGAHTLALLMWSSDNGSSYFLAQRTLTVQAPVAAADKDLDDAFGIALERLRAQQQEPGFWLTTHTVPTRYEAPQPEMNTFVTAFLVDLLEPLAAAGPLRAPVQRAREHLTSQIEENGLVRYHGLPNAPGIIGKLGCAITPDADDTALAWRIAPAPDRQREAAALATIAQYRTDEGLYRVWLSPREGYKCLDPGSDPNPADIAIQMHLLQWLATAQPSAARALCSALQPVVDQDRVWVYYRLAPLVPILRVPDVKRAGCDLRLPESRMRTTVAGQETWVSVARMVAGVPVAGAPVKDAAAAKALLRAIAKDDFALLRTNPPMLYHNDLTGKASRYYWSENVGYALWLRLAYEHAHVGHARIGG